MATKTVCDRCEKSWNDLKSVKATFEPAGEVVMQQWVTLKMCAACRKTVESRIAKAMAPPVKRETPKTMVDVDECESCPEPA